MSDLNNILNGTKLDNYVVKQKLMDIKDKVEGWNPEQTKASDEQEQA